MPKVLGSSSATFSSAGSLKEANEEYKKLPPLKDVIKTLKDGAYPVNKVAFLTQYKYYILETEEWKVNLDPSKDAIMGKLIDSLLNSGVGIWIYIKGMTYGYIYKKADGVWQDNLGEKADIYTWEGQELKFIPDDKNLDVDWDLDNF